MDVYDALRIVRRNLTVIVGALLICVIGSLVLTVLTKPTYTSSAQVFVSASGGPTVSDLSAGSAFTQQVVQSYAMLATTPLVLDTVSRGEAKGASRVTADVATGSDIIVITVTDVSSTRAAFVANSVASGLAEAVSRLTPSSGDQSLPIKITTVSPAVPSTKASSPVVPLNLIGGLMIGLLMAVVLVVAREALSQRYHSVAEVEAASSLPILGELAESRAYQASPTPISAFPMGPEAEAFRALRTAMAFATVDTRHKTYVLTSAIAGEGKTTTAINVAIAYAVAGLKTLLIDGDLRRSRVAEYLGIDGAVGLTDVLVGQVPLEEAVQTWNDSELQVLPAGTRPPNPNELLETRAAAALLDTVKSAYDVVIIDSPPLLAVSDAGVLGEHASAVVLVVGMGRSRRKDLQSVMEVARRLNVDPAGVVVTRVTRSDSRERGYGNGYTNSRVKGINAENEVKLSR